MPAGLDGNPDPIVTDERTAVLEYVTALLLERRRVDRPLMVGIDGIDGSGKSTFADELAAAVTVHGVNVVRSTIDSFHNPRDLRWARGKASPLGFYMDSHNLMAAKDRLLDPFALGSGSYVTAAFDEPSDQSVDAVAASVDPSDVLIFDGIFIQRPELAEYWHLTIFLDAQERVNLSRLGYVMRDVPTDPVEVVAHVLEWDRKIDRYSSGMQYYLDLVAPIAAADIVIDNNNLASPSLVRAMR